MENNNAKGCRVYVGNLPWKVTWPILKDHMKQAGDVVRVDIFEDSQGRSKGCGLVEYASIEEAQEAIKTLNDTEIDGRLIFVREDREENSGSFEKKRFNNYKRDRIYEGRGKRRDYEYRDGYRRGEYRRNDFRRNDYRRGDRRNDDFRKSRRRNVTLTVSNLPPQVSWKELKDLFRKYGKVVRADVKKDDMSSKELSGYVIMESMYDAQNATEALNYCNFEGYIIKVNFGSEADMDNSNNSNNNNTDNNNE